MKYFAWGSSGLRVSQTALGTMNFGDERFGISPQHARDILTYYAEEGGNVIDTAPIYGLGAAERVVGDFLVGQRDRFVVVSKVGCLTASGDPNTAGLSRKNIESAMRGILTRLRTDYLDLLLVHMHDPLTSPEVWLTAFQSLVDRGQIHHWGVSNVPGWVLGEAASLGASRSMPLTAGQVRYSLLHREAENELMPALRRWDAGVMAWAPLAGGLLARTALDPGSTLARRGYVRVKAEEAEVLTALNKLAGSAGISPVALSLGWLRDRGIVPVVGTSSREQLRHTLTSPPLPAAVVADLNALRPVKPPYPQSFLADTHRFAFGDHHVETVTGCRKGEPSP